MQLAPKEKQLQEVRARNTHLTEQVKQLSSQVTDVQRELQRVQQDTHQQIKVGARK